MTYGELRPGDVLVFENHEESLTILIVSVTRGPKDAAAERKAVYVRRWVATDSASVGFNTMWPISDLKRCDESESGMWTHIAVVRAGGRR